MGIYIKGMEMPKNGCCIQIVIDDDGKVYPSVEKCILKMGSIAKAVPVPPHGRLIDEDEVRRLIAEMIPVAKDIINSRAILEWVAEYLPQCHTVIEAEEE